ncbi:hypothetical protein DPMN_000787 [Dreissena polymorpha]|uniref:Integrase catalytic domain-containing protein n=1 Tax=Dreissena polymorpha TaxID=45954 RepID=A0A9D4MIX9_DREPO|nr:hypothetical protein DPMN_000787 [Dreissena polymorpha]
MVIHGGIDGFSRLVVFLRMSTNNRAETVMDCFTEATANYRIPSRVRCDHGGENKDVALSMNSHHGESRGSCITGKSVHNQRIERFWRDLYTGCSFRFKDLFHKLEEEGVLDLNSGVHLWSLHYIFLPRINRSLDQFVQGWNNHRLSSERGKTPNQLFVQGVIQNRGSNQTGVSEILHEPDMTEYYGVDWDGPVPQEDGEVEVSRLSCKISCVAATIAKTIVYRFVCCASHSKGDARNTKRRTIFCATVAATHDILIFKYRPYYPNPVYRALNSDCDTRRAERYSISCATFAATRETCTVQISL